MRSFWNFGRPASCCRRLLVAALAVGLLGAAALLISAVTASGSGDGACIHVWVRENDVISEKFMKDHICLIKNARSAPTDLEAFCRDFRPDQPKYQVMLLTSKDIAQLRNDLKGHQEDFHNDREKFRPLRKQASLVHYTTDNTYNFIYCEQTKKWQGKRKGNEYLRYIPHGAPEGMYKIYHGCPPVRNYKGFRQSGPC